MTLVLEHQGDEYAREKQRNLLRPYKKNVEYHKRRGKGKAASGQSAKSPFSVEQNETSITCN